MELVEMCLRSATLRTENVRKWRKQRRTLERLPSQLAESLLHKLVFNRLLSPSLLESFQTTVEHLDLSGVLSVDAEWMAYIGGFRNLRVLKLDGCKLLTNAAMWHISGLDCIEELRINRCRKISNDTISHIVSLPNLKRLGLSETSIRSESLVKLCVFRKLTHLDLGGLPVTDEHLFSLKVLESLVHLELWGTLISDAGAALLQSFPRLERINLAWTGVSSVPALGKVSYLDLSHCNVVSIFEDCGEASVEELHLARATIQDPYRALSGVLLMGLSVLELPETNISTFSFLTSTAKLVKLNLSSTRVSDDALGFLTKSAANLRWLDLSRTSVGTPGVETLAGFVPALEHLSLRGSRVDDKVFGYLKMMPSLTDVNLSETKVTGSDSECSILHLQELLKLRQLDLRQTRFSDKSCKLVGALVQLTHLLLGAEFLTDKSLTALSALSKLEVLSFQGTLLTDAGLRSFKPPSTLKELDLTGSWLLTEAWLGHFSSLHQQISLKHEHLSSSQGLGVKEFTSRKPRFVPGRLKADEKDERLQYTMPELLDLRPRVYQPLTDLPVEYLKFVQTQTGNLF